MQRGPPFMGNAIGYAKGIGVAVEHSCDGAASDESAETAAVRELHGILANSVECGLRQVMTRIVPQDQCSGSQLDAAAISLCSCHIGYFSNADIIGNLLHLVVNLALFPSGPPQAKVPTADAEVQFKEATLEMEVQTEAPVHHTRDVEVETAEPFEVETREADVQTAEVGRVVSEEIYEDMHTPTGLEGTGIPEDIEILAQLEARGRVATADAQVQVSAPLEMQAMEAEMQQFPSGGTMLSRTHVPQAWGSGVRTVEVPQVVEIERVVEVPKVVEIVRVVEVPRVVEVVKEIEKVVEIQKIVEVPRVVNCPPRMVPEVQIFEKVVIVPELHTYEKVVEVPQIQIFEKIVTIPQVQTFQKVVEVPQVQTYEKEVMVPAIQPQVGSQSPNQPPQADVPSLRQPSLRRPSPSRRRDRSLEQGEAGLAEDMKAVRIGGGYHLVRTPPRSRSRSPSRSKSPSRSAVPDSLEAQAAATCAVARPWLVESGQESTEADGLDSLDQWQSVGSEQDYSTYVHGQIMSAPERFSVGTHSPRQGRAMSQEEAGRTGSSVDELQLFRVLKTNGPSRSGTTFVQQGPWRRPPSSSADEQPVAGGNGIPLSLLMGPPQPY